MKESNGNNDLKSFLIVNKSIDDLHDLIGTEYFYYIYYSILKIIKQIYMNMRGIKQMPGNNNKMLKDLLKESKLSDYEIKIIEEPGFAENYSKCTKLEDSNKMFDNLKELYYYCFGNVQNEILENLSREEINSLRKI